MDKRRGRMLLSVTYIVPKSVDEEDTSFRGTSHDSSSGTACSPRRNIKEIPPRTYSKLEHVLDSWQSVSVMLLFP